MMGNQKSDKHYERHLDTMNRDQLRAECLRKNEELTKAVKILFAKAEHNASRLAGEK